MGIYVCDLDFFNTFRDNHLLMSEKDKDQVSFQSALAAGTFSVYLNPRQYYFTNVGKTSPQFTTRL